LRRQVAIELSSEAGVTTVKVGNARASGDTDVSDAHEPKLVEETFMKFSVEPRDAREICVTDIILDYFKFFNF
jgi:hypothetical protein